MLSLEEQIHNLADAAFDATNPVALTDLSAPTQKRNGWLLVAAAVIVGLVATSALLVSRNDNDLIMTATGPDEILTIEDELQLDLTTLVAQSSQIRIQRLAGVPVVDTNTLADLVQVEEVSLTTTSDVGGPYEYWQQFVVRTPEGTRLIVNTRGSETALPLSASFGPETEIRGRPGRQSNNRIAWLENEKLRIEIIDGSETGFDNIVDDALSLAEILAIDSADGQWAGRAEESLPPTAQGNPILAGVVAGIDWDVIENELVEDDGIFMPRGELAVRVGDAGQVVFNFQHLFEGNPDYAVAPVSVPGGAVLIGVAPSEIDQVELTLQNGTRVVVPTVQLASGPAAFAIPIDDRLDPTAMQLLSDGVAVGGSFDLTYLSPYHAGSSAWS